MSGRTERAVWRDVLSDGRVQAMDSERWTDLVSEMHALAHEQAPLYEITSEVVDLIGGEADVVHGPWLASECQSVLIPWHEAGWIDLIADADDPLAPRDAGWRARARQDGSYLVLDPADATELLHNPDRWVVGTDDGVVMLCLSYEGARHEYPEWMAKLDQSGAAD